MKNKNTYIYHFTKFESFLKIWADKTLKLSFPSMLNDMNEVSKFYWKKYNSQNNEQEDSLKNLRKAVESYRQISFVREIKNKILPCMSPVMWGHYGESGKGICIKLNMKEIKLQEIKLQKIESFKGNVTYKDKITPPTYSDNASIAEFIKQNKKELFFTKTKDWAYENEYRIISKELEYLDVSEAISEITITSLFGMTDSYEDNGGFRSALFRNVLQPMIPKEINILEFAYNGFDGISLIDRNNKQIFPIQKDYSLAE